MVEAMRGLTPHHRKKSHGIRTEKIDFVLTQICDMGLYPVLIRSQLDRAMVCFPNLPLLRREGPLNKLARRSAAAAARRQGRDPSRQAQLAHASNRPVLTGPKVVI
jgi:hypothetical protein